MNNDSLYIGPESPQFDDMLSPWQLEEQARRQQYEQQQPYQNRPPVQHYQFLQISSLYVIKLLLVYVKKQQLGTDYLLGIM